MSLANKMLLMLVGQFLVLAMVLLAIHYYFVLPDFAELEQKYARTALMQIEQRFREDQSNLNAITYDWSAWDDIYRFVDDQNSDFIQSNLAHSTFSSLGINAAFILDENKSIIWGVRADQNDNGEWIERSEPETLNSLLSNFVDKLSCINPSVDLDEQVTQGFAFSGDDLFVYAARPITDSSGEAPYRGYLMMMKHWEKHLHHEYESQLGTRFSVAPWYGDAHINAEYVDAYHINLENSKTLHASKLVYSNKFPVFTISSELDRDITKNGTGSMTSAIVSLLLVALLGALLIYSVLKSNLITPLNNLARQMGSVADKANYSTRAKVQHKDEIGKLATAFNAMLEIIERKQTKLHNAKQELELANVTLSELAKTDKLTDVANRRAMEDVLQSYWNSMSRAQHSLAILMVDIDCFKQYNDHFGHQRGDECLKTVARILRENLERSSDFLARYGGEEFIILLPDADADQASILAEKLLRAIGDLKIEHASDAACPYISVSIGISAETPQSGLSPEQLIEKADKALYQAKHNGKNRYCLSP